MQIPLTRIAPDPDQPRKVFEQGALEELARSIEQNGLMQPIIVRPADTKGHYFIVAGERRYRASCLNQERGKGKPAVECIVSKPLDVIDLRVKQIVENIARMDLTPMEEARSYSNLLAIGLQEEQAATRLGVPLSKFRQRVSLLNLDGQVVQLLETGNLDKQHAFELARLPNKADQTRLVQMINRGEIGHWRSVKKAVDVIVEGVTQDDMFGASTVSEEEVETLNGMERKIDRLASQLAGGWKEGECIIATKVSPDRAATMADKLAAIRASVRHMEQQLRNVTAQARIVMADAPALRIVEGGRP